MNVIHSNCGQIANCGVPAEKPRVAVKSESENTSQADKYEANGVLNKRHWKRIVVDVTALRSVPSSAELFDFASGFSSGIPPETRVALVVLPEQERHARFMETAALKHGVTLNSFVDPERATAWVKYTAAPQAAHSGKREKVWS